MKKIQMEADNYTYDFLQDVLNDLDRNGALWDNSWEAKELEKYRPYNYKTGKTFNSTNYVNLFRESMKFEDSRWILEKDFTPGPILTKKIEEPKEVIFWKKEKEGYKKYSSYVYNASQSENVFKEENKIDRTESFERAKAILNNPKMKPIVELFPDKSTFKNAMHYYTYGLNSILSRAEDEYRQSKNIKEKDILLLNISSFMLVSKIGLSYTPFGNKQENIKKAYKMIENEPDKFIQVIADASAIANHIIDLEVHQKNTRTQKIQSLNIPTKISPNKFIQEIDSAIKSGTKDKDSQVLVGIFLKLDNPSSADIKEAKEWIKNKINNSSDLKIKQSLSKIYYKIEQHNILNDTSQFMRKTYLSVDFDEDERNRAKNAGALWDKDKKCWYAKKGAKVQSLLEFTTKYKAAEASREDLDSSDVITAFNDAIEKAELEYVSDPIFDGRWHRIKALDDKGSKKSGSYIGDIEGIKGVVKNFKLSDENYPFDSRIDESGKYKNTNHKLKNVSKARQLNNTEEQEKRYALVSQRVSIKYHYLPYAKDNNAYLTKKGIKAFGLKEDSSKNLVMPIFDIDGKMWSWQTISLSFKGLAKGGKKSEHFFIIGADSVKDFQVAIITEGFSTGASLHMATGKPIVVAIDKDNLVKVAEVIHKSNKSIPILIAGDNDVKNEKKAKNEEARKKANGGRIKAIEAAKVVGGVAVIPELSEEDVKEGMSDFNDVYLKKGSEAVSLAINKGLRELDINSSTPIKLIGSLEEADNEQKLESIIYSKLKNELSHNLFINQSTKNLIERYTNANPDDRLIDAVRKKEYTYIQDYFEKLSSIEDNEVTNSCQN